MTRAQHILVVEEHRATADYIAEALGEAGYTVQVVADRAGMLGQLAARQPDLLLYSLGSLKTLTFDVLEAIRFVTGTTVPIIVTTTDQAVARSLDMTDSVLCLVKPFSLDELLNAVAQHVDRALERELGAAS